MSLFVSIKKKFKGFDLNVNFETNREHLGILGASGSGKSMTLKCIAGVETPDEGCIILNGRILFDSEKKINVIPQERNIGYLFQNYALFPNMTVVNNIGSGLKLKRKEKKIKIDTLLKSFHLDGLENKYPSQLSGGQQQRVALARIFAYEPEVLLLDEPFSAIDSHLKEQLQSNIMELLDYTGDVLMVTHSRDEVYKFCNELAIIDKGRTILVGKTKDIFDNPILIEAAILTGCNNISKCNILSTHSIYASDWDINLNTTKVLTNANYVALRPNRLQIVDSEEENTIALKISKVIEEVYEYTFMVNGSDNPNVKNHLTFKIKKEEWDNRKNKDNLYLKIPEDSIMTLI